MAKRKGADLAEWFYSDDKNEVERKVIFTPLDNPSKHEVKWVVDEHPEFNHSHFEYRKKERKFNEGEWYPVVFGGNGKPFVMIYFNDRFRRTPWGVAFQSSDFSFIGDSLGKLNFGG